MTINRYLSYMIEEDKKDISLKSILEKKFVLKKNIFYPKNRRKNNTLDGYWSNIPEEDQNTFLTECLSNGTQNAVKKRFPNLEDMIFDPMRAVGLGLLDIQKDQVGVDYGCMWGNLLIQAAKKCNSIVGIDQTEASLKFLNQRLSEQNLDNVSLIQENLRNEIPFDDTFDFAIINGVLEWIPDNNQIDLKKFFKKNKNNSNDRKNISPTEVQKEFLKKVHKNLKKDGKAYLAIENRWDYQYFLWKRDPHSNLFYTTFFPRFVSNLISKFKYNRAYVNYIYSIKKLEKLMLSAGFSSVDKYAVFPNYHFPRKILSFEHRKTDNWGSYYKSKPTNNVIKIIFRKGRNFIDKTLYKRLKLFNLAPAFIVIGKK